MSSYKKMIVVLNLFMWKIVLSIYIEFIEIKNQNCLSFRIVLGKILAGLEEMSSNKSIGSDFNIFVWALGCLIVLIVKNV